MQNHSKLLYGGIEGGGTKFVCAVGTGPGNILDQTIIPTTTPEQTMALVVKFFKEQEARHGALSSIGFGCFGPLDPNTASPT